MEKKKGMKAAAGGMVALSLFFGNMFSPDDDLLNNDYSSDTGVGSNLNGQVLNQYETAVDLKRYSTLQRAFLSMPFGVRALLIYPLYLLGHGIIALFSMAIPFLSTTVGGLILRVILTAAIAIGVFALTSKLLFPQMPLKKILSKKNVTAVVATSVVLSVASLVLSAVWPTYGRWAPLLRTALVVLAVSITAVSLKKSFSRIKLPAH